MGYPGCGAVSWMMCQESSAHSSEENTDYQRKHRTGKGHLAEKKKQRVSLVQLLVDKEGTINSLGKYMS